MPKTKSNTKARSAARPEVRVAGPTKLAILNLPKIGAAWRGGIYAGLSLENERPVGLVLLPGDLDEGPWDDAVSWAGKQGGVLPSRIDQLVLLHSLKSEFKPSWYWSGTPDAGAESYAWYQHFYGGYQLDTRKFTELRARAVRRVAI